MIETLHEKISPDIDTSIVESDASAMRCRYVFKMLGYERLCKYRGVRLVNLSRETSKKVEVTSGGKTFCLAVPKAIQEAHLKINIPKIKYAMRGIELTCALKNIFGCNPYQKKSRYHAYLGEAIVAVNKVMKFDLCIIDGSIVSGVQARRLGLVAASRDPVAIDCAAAKIAGLDPRKIKYLQLASKEGLGNTSFICKGVPIDLFKRGYPKKDAKKILVGKAYSMAARLGLTSRIGLE